MTLILTVQTQGSIWLVADRSLSSPGRPPVDDATKVTCVDVSDGIALLGYAGLGATAKGSQPSQWVSNVLRGRHHPMEEMLNVVANAMKREFTPHMDGVSDRSLRKHSFLIPAFVDGRPRLYSIDMVYTHKGYKFRYTRHILGGALTPLQLTVPVGLVGSGAAALTPLDMWKRPLLRLVQAYNQKKIQGLSVAKYLAQLAYNSHLATKDGTVGPDCLVIWRNSGGGGEHDFFSKGKRSHSASQRTRFHDGSIPSIVRGMDLPALAQILMEDSAPYFNLVREARRKGEEPPNFESNESEINQRLSRLPQTPDEKLR